MPAPRASEPGFRRPVLVVQADAFNRSHIRTIIAATLTSNMDLAEAPGNVLVSKKHTRLSKDSVVNVSQVLTLDRSFLTARVGRLPDSQMAEVDLGLRRILDL
jgi:mRNA interferase MazF